MDPNTDWNHTAIEVMKVARVAGNRCFAMLAALAYRSLWRPATIGRDRLMKAYVLSTERRPPPLASKWRRFVDRYLPSVVIYLMVATLVAVVLYPHVVVTVPSGQVGVLWKRFGGGTVLDPRRLRDEGLHLIWPWETVPV